MEIRAKIDNLGQVKTLLHEQGAEYKGNYLYKDIIFLPNSPDSDGKNGILTVRVYTRTNWPTKKVVVCQKRREDKGNGHTNLMIFRKEFDTEIEALQYVADCFSKQFSRGFEFVREGWEYAFARIRVYVEDVQHLGSSVEVEAADEQEIQKAFQFLQVSDVYPSSLPDMVRTTIGAKQPGPYAGKPE